MMHETAEMAFSTATKKDELWELPDWQKSSNVTSCVRVKCFAFHEMSEYVASSTEQISTSLHDCEAISAWTGESITQESKKTDEAVHACPVLAHQQPVDAESPPNESKKSTGDCLKQQTNKNVSRP